MRIINILLMGVALLMLAVLGICEAANPTDGTAEYTFGTVSGGTDSALDSVDGANLSGGETAAIIYEFGTAGKRVRFSYTCDENCTETPDDFEYVAPDNNPGTKLWVIDSYPRPVTDYDCSSEFPSGWIYIRDEKP